MKFKPWTCLMVWLFCCCFLVENLIAQRIETTHVLQEKGKAPVPGKIVSLNKKFILFSDYNYGERQVARTDIVSVDFNKRTVPYLTAAFRAQLFKEYPNLWISPDFVPKKETQIHILHTTWGKRYRGMVIDCTSEQIDFTAPNGTELSFQWRELKKIEVQQLGEDEVKRFKNVPETSAAVRKERSLNLSNKISPSLRRLTVTPTRISIVPTAFNMPAGQLYYRNSATYINEFGVAGKYFHVSAGGHLFRHLLRVQGNVPIKKYIHFGLAVEVVFNSSFSIVPVDLGEGRFAFSPILTIGNKNYFLNIAYNNRSPIFLPINDNMDDNLLRETEYWSFGGGIKMGRRFQYLTETMLIEDENQQRHLRVFNGVTVNFDRHTVGVGLSVYDTQRVVSNDNFFTLNMGATYPSFQYTVRFR